MNKKIPLIDLQGGTRKIRNEIDSAISRVLDSTAFILGPELEAFESEFATYCEASHCAGIHSGTAALHLALAGYGVGAGDEVVTVPNTFIATVEAIAMSGAKPVLVDVRADTALIDVEKVRAAITPNTKAVIPVHLFGQPCDMDPLMALAKKHGCVVIEDACQAHGSTYKGRKAGSLGSAAAFSFYPSKNLGAFGEGGAVTTNDARLHGRVKALRHHAQFQRNVHQ
jgi:dTDP-4-amino-4,6-dideoxygalactose transaminase